MPLQTQSHEARSVAQMLQQRSVEKRMEGAITLGRMRRGAAIAVGPAGAKQSEGVQGRMRAGAAAVREVAREGEGRERVALWIHTGATAASLSYFLFMFLSFLQPMH